MRQAHTHSAYDVENRLVSATGAKNATLRYDPMGRLYETSGGSAGLTRFAYDGDALVQAFNSGGSLLRRFVHGADAGDDPIVWFEGTGFTNAEQRLLRTDHQGSIVAVSDASSAGMHAINSYDEYGIPSIANLGRFQYTGQTWMPELGLYYYKARMYSPKLGRFMQTDPIGYEDDINLYAYVGIDPANKMDPSGLDTEVSLEVKEVGFVAGANHQYVYMRDTETGEDAISRGGPSDTYTGGLTGIASDSSSKSPGGAGNVKLVTMLTPGDEGPDTAGGVRLGAPVEGSLTTIKGPISKAIETLNELNDRVDAAEIDYKPRSDNSNAYAGTAYKTLTGTTPPSSARIPGSGNDLTPRLSPPPQ